MKPKIPPAPSPEDIARMQDKIAMEREARSVKIESDIKRAEAANALRSGLNRKKGRGVLVTRRGGSSYIGISDEPLGPTYNRTLLG